MNNSFSNLLIKEKRLIITTVALSFMAFLFYLILFYKPFYSTSAKIFIKDIPQANIVADFGGGPSLKSESGYSNPLFNLAQILKSKNTSTRVLNSISQNNEKEINSLNIKNEDQWYNFIKSNVKTKILPSTDTISISMNWINKKTAKDILSELINQFKAENVNMMKSVETKQRKFLEKDLAGISAKLSDVRRKIRDFEIANNSAGVDIERDELAKARVELERDIDLTSAKMRYFDRKYHELSSQVGMPNVKTALRATAVAEDPYMKDLYTNMATAQQKLADLNGTFTENYPRVISAKTEIQSLENIIENRKKETFEDVKMVRGLYDKPSQDVVAGMADSKAEKMGLISQIGAMRRGVSNLLAKETRVPSKIYGMSELARQESALKDAYNSIKSKQIEAMIKENKIVDNIFVLDSPSEPVFVSGDVLMKLAGFLYIGFLTGLCLAWLRSNVERTVESDEFESSVPI